MITLRPYQEKWEAELRDAFASGAQSVLGVLPTGGGKCLGPGTPVLMFDGTIKPVENILVGDKLMGPDSGPRTVMSLARGREKLWRVKPVKGDEYTVNESHILSLKMTGGNKYGYEDGEVINLSVSEYIQSSKTFRHCAKGWRTGVTFQKGSALPIDPYFLGLWLGDGTSRIMAITTGDSEIVEWLSAFAKSQGATLRLEPNSKNSQIAHIAVGKVGRAGSNLGNAMRALDLFHNKHIPLAFKTSSRADRLSLLAGILDTDGHSHHGGFDLALKSERLMDDAIFLARSLGFSAYKKSTRKMCTNNGKVGDYFRCFISGDCSEIPCKIARKKSLPRKQKKSQLVTGISLYPIGIGDYYGFEIDGDRLFLLGDFTVTHNTVCFSDMASRAVARGNTVGIGAHRVEILEQIGKALGEFGVHFGYRAPGFAPDPTAPVQVFSIQAAARRIERYIANPFKLLIIDEAHHAAAGTQWHALINAHSTTRVLGVTATPQRLSGEPLSVAFGKMVVGPSTGDLIALGALAPYRLFAPSRPDMTGVEKRAGDFVRAQNESIMDRPSITGDAVGHYKQMAAGKRAMVFCTSVGHAEHVASQFAAAGFPSSSLDGKMDRATRKRILRDFAAGTIKVLTSCDLVSEGFDVPAIEVIILLRPTESLALFLQMVGRGLRLFPGKTHALIFDHAGNTLDRASGGRGHGLPDDPREWKLDGVKGNKKSGERTIPTIVCGRCFYSYRPGPSCCPECQFERDVQGREVRFVDGVLEEIDPDLVRMARKLEQDALNTRVQQTRGLMPLARLALELGRAEGWVFQLHKSRNNPALMYTEVVKAFARVRKEMADAKGDSNG